MYPKRFLELFTASCGLLAILVRADNSPVSVNTEVTPLRASYPPGDVRRCLAMLGTTVQRFEVLPGGGWDNLRNKDMGLVSYMNYSLCKTTEDGKFLIPDGVMTIPVKRSRVQTFAELFDHWTSYTSSTSRDININAGLHFSNVNVSGSFSEEFKSVKSRQYHDQSVTTRIQVRYVRYEAKLQPDTPFMEEFRERLRKIAAHVTLNRTNVVRYESQMLVRDFGTHLITSVDVGAALIQLNAVKVEYARKYDSDMSSIRAAASASFFGHLQIDGGYGQNVSKTFLDEYESSRTSSQTDTLGGPIYRPQNYTADLWTDSIDNNMVALDRSGDPIYFSINEQTLPDVPTSTAFQVYREVKAAVEEYYKHNTYRGCTNPNAPNFNFQANFDDGTCSAPETNYTFGGVFQKCSSSGYTDLCADFLDQKNPLTGGYSCSEGYEAILIQTGTRSSSITRHECHKCYLLFHCCDDNTYTASATFSAYWCSAIGTVPQNHGFLFGGLYGPMLNNPFTMAKTCPTQFYELKILDNLVFCVSDDYELGYQYSVPFAGFYSCKSGNPLAMKKQITGEKSGSHTFLSFMMESGPAAYPKACPTGYSQHLATIYGSCEVNYCIRSGALSAEELPNIQRPPFMDAPLSSYMQMDSSSNLIVFSDDGSVWMTENEAALKYGQLGSQNALGSSTSTGNSNTTPSSSTHGISNWAVAAISTVCTLLLVLAVFLVHHNIRKCRNKSNNYRDCSLE